MLQIGSKGKKYGLIKPQAKPAPKAAGKPIAAFDGDSDEEDGAKAVEQSILRQGRQKMADKKVAAMQAAALAEDPSAFDYDGVYDAMQESKEQPRQQEKLQRKSRYIESLLDKAVERKREQDIRYERQLLKEREAEDHLFGDKDKFVTAAYRRKLEEDKLWQTEQKKREAEEAANDVTRRGHMGDFYRNLMSNNVAFGGAHAAHSNATANTTGGAAPSQPPQTSAAAPVLDEPEPAEFAQLGRLAKEAATGRKTTTAVEDGGDTIRGETGTARNNTAGDAATSSGKVEATRPSAGGDTKPTSHAAGEEQGTAAHDAPEEAAPAAPPPVSREDKALSARERYLARKRAKLGE